MVVGFGAQQPYFFLQQAHLLQEKPAVLGLLFQEKPVLFGSLFLSLLLRSPEFSQFLLRAIVGFPFPKIQNHITNS
jgi:hypothetical protein